MVAGNDLGRLLTQLRNVSSPLERVKLISRAWRSVKRLGPRERSVLARQIGIDGAEELIEGIAVSRGGLNPATVQRALDRLKEVRPSRLKQTLKDLQDPERRRELIDRGLTAATDALAGPEEAEPEESPQAIEIEEEAAKPAPAEPEPPAKEAPAPPPSPSARRGAAAPAAAAAVAAAAAARASSRSESAEPAAPVRPVEVAQPAPAPLPERPPIVAKPETAQPSPREERREPAAERAEPVPAAAPPPARPAKVRADPGPASELLRLVESQGMLFRRLRVLRENLALAGQAGPEQLRDLLDLFFAGWARRRVVIALLEARVPDSLEEAVFLIEQLDSKTDRRWCANVLLHEWDLSAEEQELLAARHGLARGAAASA